jgi:hypothetical protein
VNHTLPVRSSFRAARALAVAAVSGLLTAGTVSSLIAPRPAFAAATLAVDSSALTGVEMPKGATRFDKSDASFRGVLTALAKENVVSLPPQDDRVEVWIWQGDSYRADRVPFTKSGVKRALTAAGYTVTEIEENQLRDVNVFAHFDREVSDLPFRPSTTKRSAYFRAVHEAKGQALLGAWLEDDDALAVGFLPVEFKAKPKPAPLPAVSGTKTVLVKDPNETMKGIPPTKLPAFPALTRKPGTVRGYILDGGGRPIVGAEIAVYSSVGGGFRTTHKGRSNAAGLYEVLLPAGIAEIADAKCRVVYNGATYELPLLPAKGEKTPFEAKTGHVENFVLRTEGEFGGTIRVLDNINKGTLEITITPVGRLLDGSVGRTFVYRYDASESSETFLNGMPLGRYKLTARLLDDGEALPMQAGRTFGTDAERALKESLTIDFQPGYTFSQANRGKSNKGIVYFEVTLEP